MAQRLQIDLCAGVALEIEARRRVLLVAGHAGDGVVENDNGRGRFVIRNVDQSCHARVHERRIADDGDGVRCVLFAGGFVEPVQT